LKIDFRVGNIITVLQMEEENYYTRLLPDAVTGPYLML
jgi:hypothetical protein